MVKTCPINYADSRHRYTRIDNGKLLAGVSSVAEMLPKPYLLQWAANECSNYVRDNFRPNMSPQELDAMLELARKAHNVKKKKAGDDGTDMHGILELHVNARISGSKFCPSLPITWQARAYDQFLEWESNNKVEWIASELMVFNLDLDVAGRLDAIAKVNGLLTVIDFKTSNSIGSSFYLQTAGYVICLDWMFDNGYMDYVPQGRILIRLPKTETHDVWIQDEQYKTKGRYETQPNNVEVVHVPTDLGFDKETFVNLRGAFKWSNQEILKK